MRRAHAEAAIPGADQGLQAFGEGAVLELHVGRTSRQGIGDNHGQQAEDG
jgi:hypothetical protein